MTTEQKAELFDEIVNNLDNDDIIRLNKGSVYYKAGYRTYDLTDDQVGFSEIEGALKSLGYDL
jgi:hypothetical protein